MGVLTHVSEIQKDALEKINQELHTSTFILQDETNRLATDQAEQLERTMKMELKIFGLENENDALKKAESDAKTAAEHKSHGDVVVDAYDIRVRLALAHRSRVVEGHLRGDYARCVDAAVVAVCHLVDVRNQARDLGGCVRVHAGAGGVKQVERGERVVGAGRRRRRQDAVRARR